MLRNTKKHGIVRQRRLPGVLERRLQRKRAGDSSYRRRESVGRGGAI